MSNEHYNLIKSYLAIMRSRNYEEKEIAVKYFETNKADPNLFQSLNDISQNMDEPNDVRIQSLQMLRKYYQIKGNYLKFKIDEENLLDQGIEPLPEEENNDKLYLPEGEKAPEEKLLIDSLAYIDNYKNSVVYTEMEGLIKEEMNKMPSFDAKKYMEKFNQPNLEFIDRNELISNELKRIENNLQNPKIQTKINLFEVPPPSKYYDLSEWKNILDNINIQLEGLNIKKINLELIIKYGPNSWRKYLTKLDNIVKQLNNEKDLLEKENDEINKKRKFLQIEEGKTLEELENKEKYYLNQAFVTEKECIKLKYHIKKLVRAKMNKLKKRKPLHQKKSVNIS